MSAYVNPAFADRSASEVQTFRLSVQGPGFRLAPDFTLIEFACQCRGHATTAGGGECDSVTVGGVAYHDVVKVHPSLVVALQGARYFFGAPVAVTSGYRPAWYNAGVDGAVENSTHITGLGADVVVAGVPAAEVASFLRDALGGGGVGLYDDGHVHVSVGTEGGSDRRFGREWRAIYTPADALRVMPQLAPVARALGVPLGPVSPVSPTDDAGLGRYLAGLGGGLVGWAVLGLAVTLAVRAATER